jgi:hypothetical protein
LRGHRRNASGSSNGGRARRMGRGSLVEED